jgi:hypothetical protein
MRLRDSVPEQSGGPRFPRSPCSICRWAGLDNHSDEIQANDNLAGSVYAAILDKWLAGDSRQVLGGDFGDVGF